MPNTLPTRLPTVLVVEDDWLLRDDIAAALRQAGFVVLEIGTGEGAIAALRSGEHFDIVFTDIQLAGHLSGWDVAETVRSERPDMPVIYASGNSIDPSRKVEGSLFFDKPYQATEIVETVRSLAATTKRVGQRRVRARS